MHKTITMQEQKKYQYKTFKGGLSDSKMNSLGQEGWELITHTALYVPYNNHNPIQYYVFKKEISQ